jgi:hypothetical protein
MSGMPQGLTVYEPSVTWDGTTTTLTYKVKADFSKWTAEASGIAYRAQKIAANADKADPQSIEALILHYGTGGSSELFGTAIGNVEVKDYTLTATRTVGEDPETLPPYVIIPLDTALIKEYLLKKYEAAADPDSEPDLDAGSLPLVWIEENPAIGKVEAVGDDAWANGIYEDASGIRISGLVEKTEGESTVLSIAGAIENFDDGEEGRIRSIATVLVDGYDLKKVRYTATINFYADDLLTAADLATAIKTGVAANGELSTATKARNWMKIYKPTLSIVYRWAD